MNPLQVIGQYKTVSDYDRESEEFEAKKRAALLNEQLVQGKVSMLPFEQQKMMAEAQFAMRGGGLPAAIQEWNMYSNMPTQDQQRYLQMKRADQIMNLGGNLAVRNPMGGIAETYAVTPKPEQMPEFQAEQERQKKLAEGKATRMNLASEEIQKDVSTEALIGNLLDWNEQSPKMAYANIQQPFRKLIPGTSPEEASVDLMEQARKEMAAPLAKQLGVNPTDKDFQASLDRIFDISSSRESRKNQIIQLANRISLRRKSNIGVLNDGIQIEGNPPPEQPMNLYQRDEAKFNAGRGRATHVYNPATGRLEAAQ